MYDFTIGHFRPQNMTEAKWLGIILISTLILLFGGVFLLTRGNSSKAVAGVTVSQIDYSRGQRIGTDSAKVRVVEFSDLECPACSAVEPYVKKLIATYPNQVQFIYRHFPLPQHMHSRVVAALAEAAGQQGKFWEMHDKLFETQSQWSALSENDANTFFMDLVKQLGLDENKVRKDMEETATKSNIESDLAEGNRLGINQTPTFFVNGRKLNLKSFDDLNTAVAEELKK